MENHTATPCLYISGRNNREYSFTNSPRQVFTNKHNSYFTRKVKHIIEVGKRRLGNKKQFESFAVF